MQRRDPSSSPVLRILLVPIVQWSALMGVLIGVSLLLASGAEPPAVLSEAAAYEAGSKHRGPFSLSVMYQRLPPEALVQIGRYIQHYRGKRRQGLKGALARSTKYLAAYKSIFRKAGMPEELAFLPLIESGFNPNAVSPAQAVGVWQFTEETGKRFNLHRNPWFDRRRDPIVSAVAAANYLKNLHQTFGNWELSLAAYNAGAGTIRWARRVNRRAGLPEHFWALDLPVETRNYVPAFLAAVLIAKNPAAFGFHKIRFAPRVTYDRIKVTPGAALYRIAESIGLPGDDLLELNPELVRGTTPPGEKPYALRIPAGLRRHLPAKLLGTPVRLQDWVLHLVQQADTLQSLSVQFRAQLGRIKKLNGIQSDEDLSRRNLLIIPL